MVQKASVGHFLIEIPRLTNVSPHIAFFLGNRYPVTRTEE